MTFRNIMIRSGCILLGELLFATNDAIVKLSNLKISQLMIGRYAIQFLIAILWWVINKPSDVINWYGDKPYIVNIWIRGFAYSVTVLCRWYGVMRLSLGDAYCIFEQGTLVQVIMAAIFLKEKLPKTTPIMVILASIGVLFLAQPTFLTGLMYHQDADIEPLNISGLIALFISVLARSIVTLMTRTAKTAHFIQLEIVSAGQSAFTSVPLLLLLNEFLIKDDKIGDFDTWILDVKSIMIMIILGIIGFSALSLNVIGFQYAEATKVAWMEYMSLLFTFLYQIFLFKDIPNKFEIIGAVFIVMTCCISLLEEFYNHYCEKSKYSIVLNTDNYETDDGVFTTNVSSDSF